MFKLTVMEEDGYIFTTSCIISLDKYLRNYRKPRTFNFTVAIDEKCSIINRSTFRPTFALNEFFIEGANCHDGSFEGIVSFTVDHLSKMIEYEFDWDDDWDLVVENFIREVTFSCIFSNSPETTKRLNSSKLIGLLDLSLNHPNFYLEAKGDLYPYSLIFPDGKKYESKGAKDLSLIGLNVELFFAEILFALITCQPIIIRSPLACKSGYLEGLQKE